MATAVFALDDWLRKRESIFEYSDDPQCLFRIQCGIAERDLVLRDGTVLRKGDPIIKLHIWNEHVPAMSANGPSVGWARDLSRRIKPSLRQLDRHLASHPEYGNIVAISGDMALGTPTQSGQLVRIAARYGFEEADDERSPRPNQLPRRIGQNVLMLLLVLAANPAAARLSVLRREQRPVYISRKLLREICGAPGKLPAKAGGYSA